MADKSTVSVEGLKETQEVFKQLASEIGDKESRSKVLIPAVKDAMIPVLNAARLLVPVDTGKLKTTLGIQGKRPTAKDRKSKYISRTDTVVAFVATKPIPPKLKKQSQGMSKKEKKRFFREQGYDARAVANEFGTAKMPAKPFLRPALEGNVYDVTTRLGMILKNKIEQYRSKNAK
jgi:HK97 gp10 family phage protein